MIPNGLNASALKRALAHTKLVDAAWLLALAESKGVLPRSQDLPSEALVTLREMAAWGYSGLGVLVISYPWLDADHSDAHSEQLQRIAPVLTCT